VPSDVRKGFQSVATGILNCRSCVVGEIDACHASGIAIVVMLDINNWFGNPLP